MSAPPGRQETAAPRRDPRGSRVLLISFLVPPLGTVIALWTLAQLKRDASTRALRTELWVAAANGVIAVVVVWKGIGVIRWILRQFPEVYGAGW